jgi:hypothetical protein
MRGLGLPASIGLKFETVKYGLDSCGTRNKNTVLTRPSSNSKLQTRPLAREGATHKYIRNCLAVIKIWSDGCLTQDRLADWQSVVI